MKSLVAATTLLGMALTAPNAIAASSDWFKMEGASIRLVTTGLPDAEGRFKGVLEIRLERGWKTYWRDPGASGVPPELDASANPNLSVAKLDFPAPERHDEGDFQWAGYSYPVALPITFGLKDASGPAELDVNVFLGICETICVPVQAQFTVDPVRDPGNDADKMTVDMAFEAIPPTATPDFGVKVADTTDDSGVVLEAVFPGDPETAELFIAGEDGYAFSTPVRAERDGKTVFTADVTRPDSPPEGPGLHYTLVTDAGSVSGLLPYF